MMPYRRREFVFQISAAAASVARSAAVAGGQDLRFSYRSSIDNTNQPYRVYVPSSYRPDRPIALAFTLHGTSNDENSFFDDSEHYPPQDGVRNAAEEFGLLAVSPYGRGAMEYRGIGENDVFCVLEDVRKRFRVDEDRIYLTGHSMGGTGSAYLGLHHPDLFAAAAPLAAAYSYPWLAANAGQLPFLWTGGALDEEFYKMGVAVGVERMKRLGCPAQFTELAGEGHYGTAKNFRRVFEWLVQHRRVAHPESFTFVVDTPLHPRAYWVTVEKIAQPGKVAVVKGRAESGSMARLELVNVGAVSFWPDPQVFHVAQPLQVVVDKARVFSGRVSAAQEVGLTLGPAGWKAEVRPRREIPLTAYRNHPVALAPEALDMNGTEARLGNWVTDAMRAATGADVALYKGNRGSPIPAGTVDLVDLLQCSRPFDQYLVTVALTGRDIIEILDANILKPAEENRKRPASNAPAQVSGSRYAFDRRQPHGKQIVSCSLEPGRTYTVVLEGQVVERESIRLAGRFKKLQYKTTETPFALALYGYAARSRELRAPLEGRVTEIG
jgi:pimeloyl-ACP methyl ester carboxylesterase